MGTTADAAAGEPAGAPPAGPAGPAGLLAQFNALPPEAARRELLACCVSRAWADQLAAGRPYPSLAAAVARSDAAVAAMTAGDLAGALAGHPRIGERPAPSHDAARHDAARHDAARHDAARHDAASHDPRAAAWSRQEQSGMRGADVETGRALADGNAAYERRFGHIYLVCAAGRSAAELLALLRARLCHDPETERLVVRTELQKINRLRLRKLLADLGPGPAQ